MESSATATRMRISDGTRNSSREAGPPVERLTETREHRRKAGGGEAAAVGGSGVGPDSAGVHDGRWSSSGVWSVRGGVYPEADMGTPGGRSACQ